MHASSTLPAFVLSQNQTLHKEIVVGGPALSRGPAPGRFRRGSRRRLSGHGPMRSRFLVCFGMSAPPFRGPGPLRSGGGPGSARAGESMCIVQWLSAVKERRGTRRVRGAGLPAACGVPAAALARRDAWLDASPSVRQRGAMIPPPGMGRKGENEDFLIFFAIQSACANCA